MFFRAKRDVTLTKGYSVKAGMLVNIKGLTAVEPGKLVLLVKLEDNPGCRPTEGRRKVYLGHQEILAVMPDLEPLMMDMS